MRAHILLGIAHALIRDVAICGRAKPIRVHHAWKCILWKQREKDLLFQKYPDTCGRGFMGLRRKQIWDVAMSKGNYEFDALQIY